MRATCPAHRILLDYITLQYWVRCTNHLAPRYAISSIPPLTRPSQIHPNIIHPSTPRSPQWSPSLRFPHQDPTHPPLLTHTRHMPSPSHSSRFYHSLINFLIPTRCCGNMACCVSRPVLSMRLTVRVCRVLCGVNLARNSVAPWRWS